MDYRTVWTQRFPHAKRSRLRVMNFTLYGVDIPLWLLFSLALIGLLTCVVGGTIGAVSIIKRLVKPTRRRLMRRPV